MNHKTMFALAAVTTLGAAIAVRAEEIHDIKHGTNHLSMSFVTVGNPDNASDPETGYGAVGYVYQIGRYEVSQSQFDASGIARPTDWTANAVVDGWGPDKPATLVSWFDAVRYANWLTSGNVDEGVYNTVTWMGAAEMKALLEKYGRVYFLPNENEWYKAAYYDPDKGGAGGYWDYATCSTNIPAAVAGGNAPGTAVYAQTSPADIDKAGGSSPYGTMGQGGNVWEWTTLVTSASQPGQPFQRFGHRIRGGSFASRAASRYKGLLFPTRRAAQNQKPHVTSSDTIGLRIASVSMEL